MIFIVVKFETKPEWTDRWPDLVAEFTEGTRAEDGNLWFDWSRSLEKPAEYVLVEGFRDGDAGKATSAASTSRRRWRTCLRRSPRRPRSSARRSTRRAGRKWAK